MRLPVPAVPGSSASNKTLQRRMKTVEELHNTIDFDLGQEIKSMSIQRRSDKSSVINFYAYTMYVRSYRKETLKALGLPISIPRDHLLAMKANLSFSWSQLRTLRR